jgi:two-component system sensor histidine kinase SenX3
MALTAIDAVGLSAAVAAVSTTAGVAFSIRMQAHRSRDRLKAVAPRPPGASLDAWAAEIGTNLRDVSGTAAHLADVLGRIEQAMSAVPEGVVVCDADGAILHRNESAQVFAGARHGEALAELAVTEVLTAALASPSGLPAEQNLELYGPPRRALLIRAEAMYRDEAKIGAVAIIEDVTERRRLESIRRDFVANVSHELKSPVGALGILAETMQGEEDPSVARRLAERMQSEAFRVARIIDDLLDLSRIESEESPIREPVPVHVVIAQAVERVRHLAEHRGITIDVSEAPKRLAVLGDRLQLVSAIRNLLENAIKYSDDRSTVEVRVRSTASITADGTALEISVRDYGIGIPSRDLERIFERFYRVDRARARDTGGTGLGLAIVRHVATNHKGEVRVSSREGEGSTFTLRLPAAPGPVALSTPSSTAEAG